jgi:oxaloacetate decarboxylase (Na+ extruding) subunit gamma
MCITHIPPIKNESMEESLGSAFKLLYVGMLTVFAVLFLVVFIGNMIIRFTNKYVQETEKVPVAKNGASQLSIDPQKMAAIVSAISIVTQGKGKVEKVEKI